MFKKMSRINYVYGLGTGLDNITFYITFICRTFQIEHLSDMKLYLIFVDKIISTFLLLTTYYPGIDWTIRFLYLHLLTNVFFPIFTASKNTSELILH